MSHAEEQGRKSRLTRREFLKGAACVGLAALGRELITDLGNEERYARCLKALTFRSLPYSGPKLIKRGGIGFNVVYAGLRTPPCYDRTLQFAEKNHATLLRVFFDHADDQRTGIDFEPELGVYREQVLSGFAGFCKTAASRDFSLIVVLSDGYRMGANLKYNPVYGSSGPKSLSPYYMTDSAGPWSSFYTDESLQTAWM